MNLLMLINNYRVMLEKNTVDKIMRFYSNNEYEMVFEGVLIENCMYEDVTTSPTDVVALLALEKRYRLDSSRMFASEIWLKFTCKYAR